MKAIRNWLAATIILVPQIAAAYVNPTAKTPVDPLPSDESSLEQNAAFFSLNFVTSSGLNVEMHCGYEESNGNIRFDKNFVDVIITNSKIKKSARTVLVNGIIFFLEAYQNYGDTVISRLDNTGNIEQKSCTKSSEFQPARACASIKPMLSQTDLEGRKSLAVSQCFQAFKESNKELQNKLFSPGEADIYRSELIKSLWDSKAPKLR